MAAISNVQQRVGALLRARFAYYTILENTRPIWMTSPEGERLELDFYIEELRIAFEVQGQQHFIYTPHFHDTPEAFEAQRRRDASKRNLCDELQIALYEVIDVTDFQEVIRQIDLGGRITTAVESGAFGDQQAKINYIKNQTWQVRGIVFRQRERVERTVRKIEPLVIAKQPIPHDALTQLRANINNLRQSEARLVIMSAKVARYYDRWIAPAIEAEQPVLHKANVKKKVKRIARGPDMRALCEHRWVLIKSLIHWMYQLDTRDTEWETECGSVRREDPRGLDIKDCPDQLFCKNCLAAYREVLAA